ncbi:MAG: metal-binding protein [Bacteroidetes bacterium]|nr:metal-binding protein [Bacteroidota bacterium]
MWRHDDLADADLRALIRAGRITLGGHARLRIYGRLGCGSGKRMLRRNRVFFTDREEARRAGFRPCGNCLRSMRRA